MMITLIALWINAKYHFDYCGVFFLTFMIDLCLLELICNIINKKY